MIGLVFWVFWIVFLVVPTGLLYWLAQRLDTASSKKPGWYPYFQRLSQPLAFIGFRSMAEGETEEFKALYKQAKQIRNWCTTLLALAFLASLAFSILAARHGW